jgi:hypothetical protein
VQCGWTDRDGSAAEGSHRRWLLVIISAIAECKRAFDDTMPDAERAAHALPQSACYLRRWEAIRLVRFRLQQIAENRSRNDEYGCARPTLAVARGSKSLNLALKRVAKRSRKACSAMRVAIAAPVLVAHKGWPTDVLEDYRLELDPLSARSSDSSLRLVGHGCISGACA